MHACLHAYICNTGTYMHNPPRPQAQASWGLAQIPSPNPRQPVSCAHFPPPRPAPLQFTYFIPLPHPAFFVFSAHPRAPSPPPLPPPASPNPTPHHTLSPASGAFKGPGIVRPRPCCSRAEAGGVALKSFFRRRQGGLAKHGGMTSIFKMHAVGLASQGSYMHA